MSKRYKGRKLPWVNKLNEDRTPCIACGKPGSHFAPPSLHERGFFTCNPEYNSNSEDEGNGYYIINKVMPTLPVYIEKPAKGIICHATK